MVTAGGRPLGPATDGVAGPVRGKGTRGRLDSGAGQAPAGVAVPALAPLPRRSVGSRRRAEAALAYLLLAPLLAWIGLTIVYPLVDAAVTSLLDVGIAGTGGEWVGLRNYARTLASPSFWAAVGRSGVWAIGNALLQTVAALATALVLHRRIPGIAFFRTWSILSWIVPTVVVVIIWRWMLAGSVGVVNYVLQGLHLVREPVSFFGAPWAAMATTMAINAWRWFPFLAVVILAGLQTIPREVIEAASVDGANRAQALVRVVLPMLQPVLFVVGLVGTLWSLNVFDVIWLFTKGGPSDGTTTLPIYIYQAAFTRFSFGEAAAASVLMALLLLAFGMAYLRFVPSSYE
ncbi:MAG: sugar ABC transporter permease [Limnochordaceae bacterium]|nr:sugar ABC transporter permease [Limnochordaceae bacterium]